MEKQFSEELKKYMERPLQKDGLFPLDILKPKEMPKEVPCYDTEHYPPQHYLIPQGMGYRHTCPTCGKQTTIIPPQFTN